MIAVRVYFMLCINTYYYGNVGELVKLFNLFLCLGIVQQVQAVDSVLCHVYDYLLLILRPPPPFF